MEVKSAAQAHQREDVKGLVEEIIGDVFAAGQYTATDGVQDFIFLLPEDFITDIVQLRVLYEMLNQNFERWSRSNASMKASIGKVCTNLGFVAPVLAFVKQRASYEIVFELHTEPKLTR